MSTAQVARIHPTTSSMYRNGFPPTNPNLNKSHSSSPRHHHSKTRTNHRSQFLYPNDQGADSDTLNELEQQSPIRPTPSGNPSFQSSYSGPYSPNNHAVRQRLRRPIRSYDNRLNKPFQPRSPVPDASPSPTKSPILKRSFRKFPSHHKHRRHHHHHHPPSKSPFIKIAAGLSLFVFAVSIYYFYGDLLTFSALKQNHHFIIEFIDQYPISSPLIFMCFECIVVGLTIPGATVLSMAAGKYTVCLYTKFGSKITDFLMEFDQSKTRWIFISDI